jgi:hypothetical protein
LLLVLYLASGLLPAALRQGVEAASCALLLVGCGGGAVLMQT